MPERNVTTAIWTDPDFLSLSWIARYLLLHLETSTVPMSGIRYFRATEAAHAMGLPEEKVLDALRALSGTKWVQHDPVTGEIWIKDFAGRQARVPDVMKAASRSLGDVHSESLVAAFKAHYGHWDILSQQPVPTAWRPSQSGQDSRSRSRSGSRSGCDDDRDGQRSRPRHEPEGFEKFYAVYPRKQAKPRAVSAWDRLKPSPEVVAEIMAGVERYRVAMVGEESRFIAHPATWLNARRWEDEAVSSGRMEAAELSPEERRRRAKEVAAKRAKELEESRTPIATDPETAEKFDKALKLHRGEIAEDAEEGTRHV